MITPRIFEYAVPLKKPFTTGAAETLRRGYLFSLTDEDGHTGWGEAAPLPGLSQDTHELIRLEWSALRPVFMAMNVPNPISLDYVASISDAARSPAFRFAIETALLRLAGARTKQGWPCILNPLAYEVVECNGLISGESRTWLSQLARILDQGMRIIKVKMGRGDLAEELEAFRKLADRAPGTIQWRLDANRAWSFDETRLVVMATRDLLIEYIEEPLKNPEEYKMALSLQGAKLALDEQLMQMKPEDLSEYAGLTAIVLKPTIMGGITTCWEWAKAAEKLDISCTLSACFETGCGLRAIAELHSALPGVQRAIGIDTIQWLGGDSTRPPLVISQGSFEWSRDPRMGLAIDIDNLTEID